MIVMTLPEESNRPIRKVLHLEYAKEESLSLMHEIAHYSMEPIENVVTDVSTRLIDCMNLIILDNLVDYVRNDNMSDFMRLLTHNNIGAFFNVRNSRVTELLGIMYYKVDMFYNDRNVTRCINKYLEGVFLRNREDLTEAIYNLLCEINTNCSYLKERIVDCTLINGSRPGLVVRPQEAGWS